MSATAASNVVGSGALAFEFLVIGCNHKTAPIELREALAFPPEQTLEALRAAQGDRVLREAMILSTCNRTEFYSLAPDQAQAERYIRALIARFKGEALGAGSHLYTYRDQEMVRHLFRVAAGLDSMVLGEMQILGQVKEAYDLACEGGSAGTFLNRLMAAAFRVGKRARAETEIGVGAVSLAAAAVALAGKIFSDLSSKRILLVGAGETGRLAAQHFADKRPAKLWIANRTPERAQQIAAELGGEALPLARLTEVLARADVVVCATRAPGVVLEASAIRQAIEQRPAQPLALIDIAVPRDVDPAAARLENVFLYSIDALQTIVDQNLARRRRATPAVERIVEHELEQFFRWTRGLEVTPVVRALRDRFEAIRAQELAKHAHHFTPVERERLELLTKQLINKLLHHPTTRIKAIDQASGDGCLRLDVVRELFDLGAGAEQAADPPSDPPKR